MGVTLRFRPEDGHVNRTTRRSLYSHEIPPPEMFEGFFYLDGRNQTATLEVYKAHWDIQRKLIRAGHKRFLGEGNKTSTKVCKNAKFDAEAHYRDTTGCKCTTGKNYWLCVEETEEETERGYRDQYICPRPSTFVSAACDRCAWCKDAEAFETTVTLLIEVTAFAFLTSVILLVEKKGLKGLLNMLTCRCFNKYAQLYDALTWKK